MDTSKLCFGCFNEHDGSGACPRCGYDLSKAKHPFVALPIGTILNGRYLTGKVLGVGGFGVTYLAFDMTLEINVAIKEYLPSGIALRDSDRYTMTVSSPEEQTKFNTGATKFLDEARLLAKLRDVPNIVTVQDYFRENNTAYFVMEYIEGVDLMKYAQSKGGKLPFQEALYLLLPVIDSLAHVHAHNLLHRDISPDNIVVMKNGSTRLLDFGAARLAVDTEKSKSIILKHGFAPEEQYRKHGNQGPWSDEYALAATMYLIITGVMPPDAIERVHEDTLVPPIQLGVDMPQYANDALMKALSVNASGRYPDMSSFSEALTGGTGAAPVRSAAYAASTYAQPASSSTEALPTAGNSFQDGQMVEGRTVAMDQTPSESPNAAQKVLSPSILADPNNLGQQTSSVQQTGNAVAAPKTPKKSIWKRPLPYVIAGIVALAGIGTAVGVYISQNYEFGTVTTAKKTTRKTRQTEKDPTPTPRPSIPDPVVTTGTDVNVYTDNVRKFSLSASTDYAFNNNNGLFTLTRSDDSCVVYTDVIEGIDGMRIDTLSDFNAQSEEVLNYYVSDVLGYEDLVMAPDYFYVHTLNGNTAFEYSGNAYKDGQNRDITFLVYERKEQPGIFLTCGFIPADEYGMYDSNDVDSVCNIMITLAEQSEKQTDYVYYESDDMPVFVYRTSDVQNVSSGTIGNDIPTLELALNNVTDPDSRLFIISLGNLDSISTACTATEQALASQYKFGGYTSMTPTMRTNTEVRIRDYTLTKIEDESKTMDCTACVINLNGEYYSVIATCCNQDDLENVTLDFTLLVKTMVE
ncbi:MAG: serine/threonine protein kinase [Clostridiales bacterium]|nr:serine/threonine protein kinase [Clostridiales bacterium]